MNDITSFALAFGLTAALLAAYMAHLERRARRLEQALATLQAAAASDKNPHAPR